MPENLAEYACQSDYSDPGKHLALLDALPTDIKSLAAAVRNTIVHYREGVELSDERLAEIDTRWLSGILENDQRRFPGIPLDVERPKQERAVGCCRDHSLLTVAALRHQGIPARTRVGFASYFEPGFHCDHVIVEYWDADGPDGGRWEWMDPELETHPLPRDQFTTAAQVWTAYRRGEIDPDKYGVGAHERFFGDWFIRNYVISELAHRQRDELLLWDLWGAHGLELGADLAIIDQVAALLLAADDGDDAAERELAELYRADPRLNPGGSVNCLSPSGQTRRVDLVARR